MRRRGDSGRVEDRSKGCGHSIFSDPGMLEFFSDSRRLPEDLYPSELRFLPWLASESKTVLDVGCAVGGLADIWTHFAPEVSYVGSDVSPELIAAARRLRPSLRFEVGDASRGLPFDDRGFDVVQGLGWLHWEPRFADALREMWRMVDHRLFFDVRLARPGSGTIVGEQRLAFGTEGWDGETTTPYIVVDLVNFVDLLLALEPFRILAYGYLGEPDDLVIGIDGEVCFATFVLERSLVGGSTTGAWVDMPWNLPERPGLARSGALAEVVPEPDPPRC